MKEHFKEYWGIYLMTLTIIAGLTVACLVGRANYKKSQTIEGMEERKSWLELQIELLDVKIEHQKQNKENE